MQTFAGISARGDEASPMGPQRGTSSRDVALMTLAVWLLIFIATSFRTMVGEIPFWPQVMPRVVTSITGIALCWVCYLVLRPLQSRSLALQLFAGLGASLAVGLIDALITWEVNKAMLSQWMDPPTLPYWQIMLLNGQSYSWVFLTWCGIYFAMSYSRRLRDNQLRLLETQALAADAQNRMLRYQINPHFLFNTLNAISSLVLQKQTDRAEQMLMALSGFLRYSLARAPDERVPLREEAEAQEEYLRIEQARFGGRLKFVVSLEPGAAHAMAPSLILQPLVENAVKYAVAVSSDPVTIELIARRLEDNRVLVEVRDDGPGPGEAARGLGVGLENVRRRLEIAYGGKAVFEAGPREPRGFCARIVLPPEEEA